MPLDDPSDPSSDSSKETDESSGGEKVRRRKKKSVKSGAKIKKRPVVKSEDWPHIIANEENGGEDEVNSTNISLSEFLTCFSHIMLTCKSPIEKAGRSALLNAISLILKCLPWAEARNFHNVIMYKIEQDRLNWSSDFQALGKEFLDNKVRLNLRSRTPAVSKASSSSEGRSSGRSFGSSRFNSYNRFNQEKSKMLHTLICHQWNAGSCSYGDNCRRWHICKSCADAGKIGEAHKSSSHSGSASRPRQGEPRV